LGKVTSIMVSPSSLHQRVDQLREAVGRVLRQAVGGQPIALSELKALHDQREELVSDLNQMLKRLVVWYRDGLWIETESINASWGDPIRASLEARQPEPLWDAWRDTCLQSGLGEVCPIDTASIEILDTGLPQASRLRGLAQELRKVILGRGTTLSQIQVMRKLFLAVPHNQSVQRQVADFERQSVERVANEVKSAIASGDRQVLADAVECAETLRWTSKGILPLIDLARREISTIDEATALQVFTQLAQQVSTAFESRDLYRVGELKDQWDSERAARQRDPQNELRMQVSPAWDWLSVERKRLFTEASFEQDARRLRDALDSHLEPLELESLEGQLLAHGLPVPADIELRMNNARKLRAAAVTRAHRRWIVVASVGVIACVALLALGVQQLWSYRRAETLAETIRKRIDDRDFVSAKQEIDALDKEMLDYQAVKSVLARFELESGPAKARRMLAQEKVQEIDRFLEECRQIRDESALAQCEQTLDRLRGLSKEAKAYREEPNPILKLDATSRGELEQRSTALEKEEIKLTSQRSRLASQQVDELQRRWRSECGSFDDLQQSKQSSEAALSDYLARIEKWEVQQRQVVAAVASLEAQHGRVTSLAEAAEKSKRTAEERLKALRDFEPLWKGLWVSDFPTVSSWLERARKISVDYRAIIVARNIEKELQSAIRAAEQSAILENFGSRLQAIVQQLSFKPSDGVPVDAQVGIDLVKDLTGLKDENPGSAIQEPLTDWIALTNSLTANASQDLRDGLKQLLLNSGWLDLEQVELKGPPGVLFCRQGRGVQGPIRQLNDLAESAANLTEDLKLRKRYGPRSVTVFCEPLTREYNGIDSVNDRIVLRKRVFDLIDATISGSDVPMARAAIALRLLEWTQQMLLDRQGEDAQLDNEISSLLIKHRDVKNADWPAKSIAGDSEKPAQKAISDLKGIGLKKMAEEFEMKSRSVCDELRPLVFRGFLRAPDGENFYVPSPTNLQGEYLYASVDQQGRVWSLTSIRLHRGGKIPVTKGRILFLFQRD